MQLPANLLTSPQFDLAAVEKKHIAQILHYTHGNKAETARLLGIGLSTLYRKIEQYHLSSTLTILAASITAIY